MSIEEQIAQLERAGYRVVTPRDSKDDQLRELWDHIQRLLRMAKDIAEDGGRLTVRHPGWLNKNACAAKLLRDGAVRSIDTIFQNAVVEGDRDVAA